MKTKKDKELILEQLRKTPIVQVACEKTGIARATYYRWRKKDKRFLEGCRYRNCRRNTSCK